MMLPLLLSLVWSAVPAPAAPAVLNDDPPVKVWLNHDNYFQRGDKARVNVRLADDGYLVVLRADTDGRVRVLFPVDPSDDGFVRGRETIEVRGRGDREAFYVDDREGSGVVLTARSAAPFKFDEFVRGDHWDYRVLDARQAGDDKEAALLDIVQRMTDGHFDYDMVTYAVASARTYSSYYPHYSVVSVGYGYPYYSTCYDPFFYDPFVCYDPFFAAPYGFGFGFGYGYRPYAPFIFYGGGSRYRNRPRDLFINRGRTPGWHMEFRDRLANNTVGGAVGPRFRVPQGTLVTRRPDNVGVRGRDNARQDVRDRQASFPDRGQPAARDPERRSPPPDRAQPAARGPERRSPPPDRAQPAARGPERRSPPPDRGQPAAREPERRSPPPDRGQPAAREPERRGGGGGGGRSAPPRASSGGDHGRGGGGGGGGGRPSNGGGGGGSRRRP
jgi:hypothetical protein